MGKEADDDDAEENAKGDFVERHDEEHGADRCDDLVEGHVAVSRVDAAHAFDKAAEGIADNDAKTDKNAVHERVELVVGYETELAEEGNVIEKELQVANGDCAENAEEESAECFVFTKDAFAKYFCIAVKGIAEAFEVSAGEDRHHICDGDREEKVENTNEI